MFVSNKTKGPIGNLLRDKNSRSKMPEEFIHHSINSGKRKPNLLQTKLCMRRSYKPNSSIIYTVNNNDVTSAGNRLTPTTELFIMPMPKEKYVTYPTKKLKMIAANPDSEASTSTQQQRQAQTMMSTNDKDGTINAYMPRLEHKLRALIGRIDYALQIQKQYPKLSALWNLYGKLIKISRGKQRFEQILLLRNLDNRGPIMRCIYYDFNNSLLKQFTPCCDVRAVGRVMVTSNFRIFKLLPLRESTNDEDLIRIQNVNTFVLQNAAS